ncbi:substrate-binding periplasmic protein [Thalassolituus sp. LLYu03]|uniref:substrate-binding periplasmic protein n=1 Tax=Thalassolituus sp. LLYu03 TaxID=3421656 RepID=UPI003D2AFAEF
MNKLLTLLILISSSQSYAADDGKNTVFLRENIKAMSVVAPEWEGQTNADGTGLYWDVLKTIYEPVGVKVKTANVPWNRAMKMVTKYQVYNAIAGEYKDSEEDLLFPDYALDVEYMSVLSMASKKLPWDGVASLKGKRVGWIKDYDLITEDKRDFELVEYRSTAQGIELLQEGKIDYLIDEWNEIAAVVAERKEDMTLYRMGEMPEGTDVYVGFANTPLSQVLISIYNERVPELMRQKQLQPLYKKWESEVPASVTDAVQGQ